MEHEKKGRMTRQRMALLERLRESHDHPTADELFRRLQPDLPKLSLATVYRNLDRLADEGHIRVINVPGEPRRFDGDLSSHYHVRCVECGKISDVELDRIPDLGAAAYRTGSFKILSMKLEFEGVCDDCLRKKSTTG